MRNKWLLLPMLFLLPACASLTSRSMAKAQILYQNQTFDNVKIGDKIEVTPKTLTYNDQSKEVNGQIILPDGTSKVGNSFTIEMPGIYEVRYRAFFGVHEESVSLFYHCHRTSGDFFISSSKNNPATTGQYSHPADIGEIKGAKLKLDSRTVFTYDGEIDFNSFDFSESFINFIVDTSKQGTSDLEKFTIRLTDTEDSNNYVDITVTDSGPVDNDGRGCYLLAGSNNQYKIGFEGGRIGKKHVANKYGTNLGMSFRDLPDRGAKLAKLYFNYQTKELYASPIIDVGGKDIITDLDDRDIYGSTVWGGFTNGKAKLSIFANSLITTSATLIVTKVGSQDLSPLDFVDEVAPSIRVNYNGQSSINVPKASINKPYRIFDATVNDNFNHQLSYSTYVTFYDEANDIYKDVTITNGCFTPKEVGTYIITYTAKDYSNNYGTKTVEVTAISSDQHMEIDLDSDTINQNIFTKVTLPSINEIRTKITGGSGKPTIERTIFDSNNNQIFIEGDSFVPEKVGEYKVYYKATDYIGNISTKLVKVNATDPGHPMFIDKISLPRVLLKGHQYSFPTYKGAEVVNNETVYLESKVYVDDALLEDNKYTADGDSHVIKYQLEGTRGTINDSTTLKVVDCGSPLDLTKYFSGDDFDKQLNEKDLTLSASSGNASTYFINALSYNKPYVKFAFDAGKANFDELVFKFSDSLNESNSLSFHVKFKSDNTYISIGNSTEEFEFSFADEKDSGETYIIDFSNVTKVLKDVYHKDVTVVKYNDNGEPFTGFTSGIYLDIEMKGIQSQSALKILKIDNQPIGRYEKNVNPYADFTEPVIIYNADFYSEQEYGNDAFIPTVSAFDVLSKVDVTVSVRAPDETFIFRNKDATKSQTFTLNQFGDYLVIYNAIDEEGNETTYRRLLTVRDNVAPEFTITGKLNSTYSINSAIRIPAYKVTDNLNDYTVDIFVIMPDDDQRLLMVDHNGEITSYLTKNNMIYNSSFKVNSNTFRAEQYGRYTLRYVAYDSDYNKVVKELYFTVK